VHRDSLVVGEVVDVGEYASPVMYSRAPSRKVAICARLTATPGL
jgi:hypothetical protein